MITGVSDSIKKRIHTGLLFFLVSRMFFSLFKIHNKKLRKEHSGLARFKKPFSCKSNPSDDFTSSVQITKTYRGE